MADSMQASSDTGQALARVSLPAISADSPEVLFCGGFHSTMQGNKATWLEAFCRQRGWGHTRFDYRGHGESPGSFVDCTLHDWLDDTLTVLDSLPRPAIVIGSSMGAWLAVLATLRRPGQVCALLTLAAAPDFTEQLILPQLAADDRTRLANGDTVHLPSEHDEQGWPVREPLFASGRALALLGDASGPAELAAGSLAALRCPVRMIHGTADRDVPCSCSEALLARIGSHDASLLLLKDADHRLSDEASLAVIGATLAELVQQLDVTGLPHDRDDHAG